MTEGEARAFLSWLNELTPDELRGYVEELRAFSDDENPFGAFARGAAPIVERLLAEREVRDWAREAVETVLGLDPDVFLGALGAAGRAKVEFGGTLDDADVLDCLHTAHEVAIRREVVE